MRIDGRAIDSARPSKDSRRVGTRQCEAAPRQRTKHGAEKPIRDAGEMGNMREAKERGEYRRKYIPHPRRAALTGVSPGILTEFPGLKFRNFERRAAA